MADVAARAGVSHQTVSRVVNGHPSVAPATRERVERAIAELGYRPNIAARALVTGSTRTIGLVTVKINQYGPAQTMLGLEKAARAAGYSLSVSILDDATAGAMRDAVDTFVAQRVDADRRAEHLRRRGRGAEHARGAGPAGRRPGGRRRGTAGRRRRPGDRRAAGHPAPARARPPDGAPRRRPGRLAGGAGAHRGLAGRARGGRRAGARAAARRLDAVVRATPPGGSSPSGSRTGEEITAVFLANDQMALGLLAAFHESGIEAPDDVSIVGFDDLPEAPYFTPAADDRPAGLRRARPTRRAARAGPAAGRGPAPAGRAGAARRAGQHRPGEDA